DLRIRDGHAAIQRERDLAAHVERETMMREWVANHGSRDQQDRFAAGVLPKEEWIKAVTDATFAPLSALTTYESNGAICLQAFLRQHPQYATAVVMRPDVRISTRLLTTVMPRQWETMQQVRAAIPTANMQLRERELAWTREPRAPRHRTITLLVTTKVGSLTVRREFNMAE